MQQEPIPVTLDRYDRIERDILYLLTGVKGEQPIWSLGDLGREMESQDDADVGVRELRNAGLVHMTSDGHVFASRAGVRMVQLVDYAS
jgi:hypothetical protein